MSLLAVNNLQVTFKTEDGIVRAVNGLSLSLEAGETLGIVGESGSGKSVTALSIMRLIAMPPGRIESGSIQFGNQDLLRLGEAQMRQIRGDQIAEAITLHQHKGKREAMQRAIEMLKIVRIPEAEKRINNYPHQFSGGMRQRVMIAMALACD